MGCNCGKKRRVTTTNSTINTASGNFRKPSTNNSTPNSNGTNNSGNNNSGNLNTK